MLASPRRFYYGWLVVAAASGIGFANAATAIGMLTVFVNPMIEEFGWTRTEMAGATSLGAVLGAALAPFTGRLVDRVGSRLVLVVGGVAVALGCFYLSLAHTLLGFYVAFTLARIADQGLVQIGTSASVGKWFFRRRGRAMGLLFFAVSAGVIILAPTVQLIIGLWGWRVAWMFLGALMFVLGVIPSALLVRRQPEDLGLPVDGIGDVPDSTDGDAPEEPAPPAGDQEEQWLLAEVVRTPAFWLILISLFIVSSGVSGIGLHLMPHLIQQGLSPGAAVGAISIMSTSGALGALLMGFLADRVSPRLMMVLAYLLGAVSMLVLLVTDTMWEAYVFAVLQGLVMTGINTLAPILWASYYGRTSLGSIYGLSRASQICGFAVGPLAAGIAFDLTGSYSIAIVCFAGLAMLGTLVVLASRRPRKPLALGYVAQGDISR
jgi:MFS transporter, OFA family, oxalate/formate antiporter